MLESLALLGVSVASALVPLINLEVYLVGMVAVVGSEHLWLYAVVAGLGQMIGKVVWYYLGANALSWRWVRKKLENPKSQARLDLWRQRTHDRPAAGASLLLVSGVTGFPPFAIVAVLAGQLRMNLLLFVTVTLVSRTLRFWLVLYFGEQASDWLFG